MKNAKSSNSTEEAKITNNYMNAVKIAENTHCIPLHVIQTNVQKFVQTYWGPCAHKLPSHKIH